MLETPKREQMVNVDSIKSFLLQRYAKQGLDLLPKEGDGMRKMVEEIAIFEIVANKYHRVQT